MSHRHEQPAPHFRRRIYSKDRRLSSNAAASVARASVESVSPSFTISRALPSLVRFQQFQNDADASKNAAGIDTRWQAQLVRHVDARGEQEGEQGSARGVPPSFPGVQRAVCGIQIPLKRGYAMRQLQSAQDLLTERVGRRSLPPARFDAVGAAVNGSTVA